MYLTDFGLAQRFGEQSESVFSIHPAGTAAFMAPEQIDARFGPLGPWTDVYGLGGVLHVLLFGQPPYTGTASEILAQVTSTTAISFELPAEAPELQHLAGICRRCLSQTPAERYRSMEELTMELMNL